MQAVQVGSTQPVVSRAVRRPPSAAAAPCRRISRICTSASGSSSFRQQLEQLQQVRVLSFDDRQLLRPCTPRSPADRRAGQRRFPGKPGDAGQSHRRPTSISQMSHLPRCRIALPSHEPLPYARAAWHRCCHMHETRHTPAIGRDPLVAPEGAALPETVNCRAADTNSIEPTPSCPRTDRSRPVARLRVRDRPVSRSAGYTTPSRAGFLRPFRVHVALGEVPTSPVTSFFAESSSSSWIVHRQLCLGLLCLAAAPVCIEPQSAYRPAASARALTATPPPCCARR